MKFKGGIEMIVNGDDKTIALDFAIHNLLIIRDIYSSDISLDRYYRKVNKVFQVLKNLDMEEFETSKIILTELVERYKGCPYFYYGYNLTEDQLAKYYKKDMLEKACNILCGYFGIDDVVILDKGKSIPELATEYDMDEATVHFIIKRVLRLMSKNPLKKDINDFIRKTLKNKIMEEYHIHPDKDDLVLVM
jgi:hypothetical protein